MGMWIWLMMMMMVISVKWWCGCCLGCWDEERIALINLKSSLHFPTVTSDCCQWEVVECDPISGRVAKLSLNNTSTFILGDWLFNASLFLPFQELTTLLLQETRLVGSVENEGFDRLSRLSKLEVLDLSDNYLINNNNSNIIISSLTRLSSLKSLSLKNIQDYGSTMNINIDGLDRLSRLINLEVLDLSGNHFNNSNFMISSLSRLSSLKSLSLRQIQRCYRSTMNNIDGFDRLSRLSKLEVLDLSDSCLINNNNSNIIISSLGRLSSLKSLSLRRIQLDESTMNNIDGFAGYNQDEPYDYAN